MEIREEYKKTEVGVIPQEWDTMTFGDLFTFNGGLSASRDQLSLNGLCYLHYGDIHKSNKTYIDVVDEYSNLPKLDIAVQRISNNALLNEGDVVFVDASEDDEGASKHIVIRNACNIPFISGLHTIVSKSKTSLLDNRYKEFCFQSEYVKKQFKFYSAGTKVCGVSKGNIVKMLLPIPPLPEQQAIATALSDMDGLISSLTKQIDKKKNIKQGAMHELLTGKKRLDGFSGEWQVKSLGEICDIKDGTHQTPQYVYSGIPFYSVENVTQNEFRNTKFISDYEHSFLTKSYRIEKDDILMTRIGSIGACKYIDWDVNASFYVSLALLKVKKGFDSRFICQYSNTDYFKKEIELNSLQSAIPKKINLGQISNIELLIPKSEEEQTAITKILRDMDEEIEKLTAKLEKYKAIKQGMMQELLTGRIRLVEEVWQ